MSAVQTETRGLAPWQPEAGAWNRSSAAHLVLRATLGASESQLEEALGLTPSALVEAWIQRAAEFPAQPISAAVLALGREDLARAAWIERLTEDPTGASPLAERMALLWHGHFATSNAKVGDPVLMQRQIQLFREHGLGDFRELLARALRDPAMLIWLDGVRNRKQAPNENLARELFELFALGRGAYTERDVQEAARALTGWRVRSRQANFQTDEFDDGVKTVLGRRGPLDLDGLVEATCAHPACARFLAHRLASEFLNDQPSASAVESIAAELVRSDWDLGATLQALLSSETFFAPENRDSILASPVAFVVRALRALPLETPPTVLASATEAMGQALLAPPSVEGWHTGRAWVGAAGWIERERTAERLARDADRVAAKIDSAPEALLERLLPGATPPWAETYQQVTAQHSDGAPGPLVRALLTAPEFHLL